MRFSQTAQAGAVDHRGFTYIELLVSLLLGSLLMLGITGALSTGFNVSDTVRAKNTLNQQARFAMQRMQQAVSQSPWLLLPYSNATNNTRDVLAVTLAHSVDNDGDGRPDADNDGDGRFDEDLPADTSNDFASGIFGIDDDGDGVVDEGLVANDDEFSLFNFGLASNEDPVDGNDNDFDGTIDEDPGSDMNADGCPGICGVDDDGDRLIDELVSGGNAEYDDDEDGQRDEDWYDPVVFHLNGSDLIERTAVPWDADGDGDVDGRDYVEQTIAANVTQFKVVREPMRAERAQLLSLTLKLTDSSGQTVQLSTQVRLGGAL